MLAKFVFPVFPVKFLHQEEDALLAHQASEILIVSTALMFVAHVLTARARSLVVNAFVVARVK